MELKYFINYFLHLNKFFKYLCNYTHHLIFNKINTNLIKKSTFKYFYDYMYYFIL